MVRVDVEMVDASRSERAEPDGPVGLGDQTVQSDKTPAKKLMSLFGRVEGGKTREAQASRTSTKQSGDDHQRHVSTARLQGELAASEVLSAPACHIRRRSAW